MSSSYVQLVNPKAEVASRGQAMMLCISAATGLQEVLKSNLGPRGTLKMLVSGAGDIKITKDGKVLLSEMQIQNPVAMMIARAATAQDDIAGDGSTSNILLIAEILKLSGKYVSEGLHPRIIVDGISMAANEAINFLESFKINKNVVTSELLEEVVYTSIRTKLSPELSNTVSKIIADALQLIRPEDGNPIDLHMIEIQKMQARRDTNTRLIKGLVLDHGTRHINMPTSIKNAYVLALNVSLEYEKSEINSGFFYSSSESRDILVDSERKFLNEKLNKIVQLKNAVCDSPDKGFIIINKKGIDPLSLEVLAKNGIMALRRAKNRNMERLQLCCGCTAQNSVDDLSPSVLGYAGKVYEYILGENKYTFIEEVKMPKSVTILITAPNKYSTDQINDAIRDGLRAAKNAIEDKCVVPGAGSFYVALYNHLNKLKGTVKTKYRIGLEIFAEALLVIPKILSQNSGHDILTTIMELQSQNTSGKIAGLNLVTGKAMDPVVEGVYDNYTVLKHILSSCTTISSNFLLVDEIIKAGKSSTKAPEVS